MAALQWPGYEPWERQIQIRDQTRQRNEITLERFVKLVAGVVDRFLTVWPFRFLLSGTYDGLMYPPVTCVGRSINSRPRWCLEGWTGGDH